ncbi:hypothetical protein C7475_1011192 [Chitinophaga sp. S165]|nr:hypothetical protein C7475_1011192 [Chitinophaga sp. S165]
MIGFLVGIQMGVIYWMVMLAIAAFVLLSYWSSDIVLSMDVVDDHLVLQTTKCFEQKTTRFNIREIELQLFYTLPTAKKRGFYSMYVMRSNKVQTVSY